VIERTIATNTHGRYLVQAPEAAPAGLLIGFHGYAEGAEALHAELAERASVTALVATHDPEALAARSTARLALA
jgi:hypothetical protein